MSWKARIEFVSSNFSTEGVGAVYAVQTLTGTGSTVVSADAAPSFPAVGGKPAGRGQARITVISGAALLGINDATPTEAESIRVAAGMEPLVLSIAQGAVLSFAEAADAPGGSVLGAGENHIGKIGGEAVVHSVAPVVSTTQYSSGDVIGSLMTFAGFGRVAGGTGLIQMAAIQSKTAQTFACDLVLFHTNPSASTFTDNVAVAVNAADFDKVLGVVHITDWTALGGPSFAEATQLAMAYKTPSGQVDIYGVLVARAAPTLSSTSDLKVVVKSLLD